MENSIHVHICKWLSGKKTDSAKFESICKAVCHETGISMDLLKSKCRKREHVISRGLIFIISRQLTSVTLKSMGLTFGIDHSTVINSCLSIKKMMETDYPGVNEHYKKALLYINS